MLWNAFPAPNSIFYFILFAKLYTESMITNVWIKEKTNQQRREKNWNTLKTDEPIKKVNPISAAIHPIFINHKP